MRGNVDPRFAGHDYGERSADAGVAVISTDDDLDALETGGELDSANVGKNYSQVLHSEREHRSPLRHSQS